MSVSIWREWWDKMRIVKEAEERKNEILDVAERLFGTKGFDNTSTNDILNEIGIARGTLYYHFKSKEDILDAMIERMSRQLIKKGDGHFQSKRHTCIAAADYDDDGLKCRWKSRSGSYGAGS